MADLAITGAQVVRQAFRLGVLVDEVLQNLEPPDTTKGSSLDTWAYVMPNVSVEEVQHELDAIRPEEVSLSRRSFYFSEVGVVALTIYRKPLS
jgi:monodictyphenone polyketide synthase